jgi:hypothetical protein
MIKENSESRLAFFLLNETPDWTRRPYGVSISPPVHFALLIVEMGSQELFDQAGLEPRSSQSQPPK